MGRPVSVARPLRGNAPDVGEGVAFVGSQRRTTIMKLADPHGRQPPRWYGSQTTKGGSDTDENHYDVASMTKMANTD